MNLGLVSEHSLWFLPLCILLAFAYAFIFYYKDSKFDETKKWLIKMMFGFRFVVVLVLLFLLLSPMIRYFSSSIEKPILLIAQDNSKSITINQDSTYYKQTYLKELSSFKNKLAAKFELISYTFGDETKKSDSINFNEKQTNFSSLFDALENRYSNRNVGALIVLSDGLYNKGSNPIQASQNLIYPIYTVALGDTVTQKDVAIVSLKTNKTAFLSTKFPVQITVSANQMIGKKTILSLTASDKIIYEQEIVFQTNTFFKNYEILVDADKVGLKVINVNLSPNDSEISKTNNSKTTIVEIVDSKQKVLVISNSPHPDLNALLTAIEPNIAYDLQLQTSDNLPKKFNEYNLVVLHQLPSLSNKFSSNLKEIYKANVPILYILGGQSDLAQINELKTFVSINYDKQSFEDAQPSLNKNFSLFEIPSALKESLSACPPLLVPFGEYQLMAGSDVLFNQSIKGVLTNKPLIAFSSKGETKIGFIMGEGLWRWKTYLFLNTQQHQAFEELIGKIFQYMSIKTVKDNFIVNTKKIISEEESIEFSAEVYNESYEMVENAKLSLELTLPNKNKMQYELSSQKESNKRYYLNIGTLPVGKYTWSAKAEIGAKTHSKAGVINVLPLQIEADNTTANHQLLNQLAKSHEGKMFGKQEWEALYQILIKNENIKPVVYTEKKLQDLIRLKLIFFLLLSLLSVEWFIRKFKGGY